jgi:O-antigen/teichoic acid export membrane protein
LTELDLMRDSSERAPESVRTSTLFAGAVQLAGTLFTALLTLFLVRALSPGDYGRYAIVIAVGSIVLLPSDFGLSSSTARSIAEAYGSKNTIAQIFAVALRLKIISAIVIGAIIFAVAPLISTIYGDPSLTTPIRIMGVAVAAQTVFGFASASFTALRRMRAVLGIVTLESAAETAFCIALVAAGAGVVGAVTGRAIGYALGAAAGLLVLLAQHGGLRVLIRKRFDPVLARALAVYAGAIALVDAIWAVLSQVDVLIMGVFLAPAAVASFQAPARLLSLATYPGLALSNALGPRLAQGQRSRRAVSSLATSARVLVIVQTFAAAFVFLYAHEISAVVLGHAYRHSQAELVLRCLAPFVMLSGLAPLLSNAIDYVGGARRRIWIAAVTLALNVALNLILVPWIGPVGAAVAVDCGYAFFGVGHLNLCRDLLNFPVAALTKTGLSGLAAAGAMMLTATAVGLALPGLVGLVAGAIAGAAAFGGVIFLTPERFILLAPRT